MHWVAAEAAGFTLFTGLYLGAIGGESGVLNEVQAAYLATCQYLPNLPGFGRLAAYDVCRIADLQQLHEFLAGIHDVKVRYLARIFYIG